MSAMKNWLIVLLVGVCTAAYAQKTELDVPYVPTDQKTVEEMLKLAGVKPGDVVYDLGCGDGRIVITAAAKFGATGVGVDLNPERIKEANANAAAAGVTDKVTFVLGDLFEFDFSKANVVTMYLLPSVNLALRPKLQKELKPGSRIVSHDFDMGDWKPEKTVRVGTHDTIFLWTIK
ncbi:SAM-dependent methyltransferase [Parapedobacter soli]|uniref:SAM-dependent methyltransferase n=1 Tax=Parapedobacter soli TaxID=416955 RepID=UPI0021C6057A|nr:methyltransferase domain-containing protein [Parapedobacter soli]